MNLQVTYEIEISENEKIDGVFFTHLGGQIDRVWRKGAQGQWTPMFPVVPAFYQSRFTPFKSIPTDLWETVKNFYDADEVSE